MSEANTEKRFLSSTLASYGSQFGRTVLRLVTDLTLARLLIPEQHGLFALAWSTVLIAGYFRDLGLPYEIIRSRRQPYGALLLWEVVAGSVVTLGLIVAAPLFAGLDPDLPAVLRVLSLFVLFEGLAVAPRVFFERDLRVTELVLPEIGRSLIMATVSIVAALQGFGVWSFVGGELAAIACFVVFLWWRARRQIPLRFEPAAIPSLLRHSVVLFLIALVFNSTPFVGRYIVEIVDSTAMVGQYEKALLWAMRAQILFVPALIRALYPALVAYRGDRRRFVDAYRLGTLAILSVEVLVAYFIFFNAEIVILDILLGDNWQEAAQLIKILCFVPLVDPFTRLGGELLKVRREDRTWLAIALTNLLCLAGFGWILSQRLGPDGMAWAHYLLLGNLFMAWRVKRICGPDFWGLLKDLAVLYLVPLPFYLGLASLLPAASWGRFAASLAVTAIVGSVSLYRFWRPFKAFFLTPGHP